MSAGQYIPRLESFILRFLCLCRPL